LDFQNQMIMGNSNDVSKQILSQYGLTPQEEVLEVSRKKKKYSIGIPFETTMQEGRVPLAPLAVESLIDSGHKVIIQRDIGKQAHFPNEKYAQYGAVIVNNAAEIYQCDIIIKVAPFTLEEIELLKPNQIVISNLHSFNQDKAYFANLLQKKVIAIAYDLLKDEQGSFPIVRSMSEIAGRSSILIASEYLSNVNNGKGEMLGGMTGVSPSEIVILGAGTAGEYAARTALGLGAQVRIFDKSVHRLTRLVNALNLSVYTSVLQPQVLERSLVTADVVIGAMRSSATHGLSIVTEEMVKKMKPHSVIVDISIDQGGCIETSRPTDHKKPVFTKHGVIHYCVPNIAARVARTASYALSNIISPILLEMGETGNITNFLKNRPGVRNGVYVYNGILTNRQIGERMDMYSRDIDLLISAM
jgi:alanine dehydrogenase